MYTSLDLIWVIQCLQQSITKRSEASLTLDLHRTAFPCEINLASSLWELVLHQFYPLRHPSFGWMGSSFPFQDEGRKVPAHQHRW